MGKVDKSKVNIEMIKKAEGGIKNLIGHFNTNLMQKVINKERIKFKSRIPDLIRKHFFTKKNGIDIASMTALLNLKSKLDIIFHNTSGDPDDPNVNLGYRYVS